MQNKHILQEARTENGISWAPCLRSVDSPFVPGLPVSGPVPGAQCVLGKHTQVKEESNLGSSATFVPPLLCHTILTRVPPLKAVGCVGPGYNHSPSTVRGIR